MLSLARSAAVSFCCTTIFSCDIYFFCVVFQYIAERIGKQILDFDAIFLKHTNLFHCLCQRYPIQLIKITLLKKIFDPGFCGSIDFFRFLQL